MKTGNHLHEELASLRESITSIERETLPVSAQTTLHQAADRIDRILPEAKAQQDALNVLVAVVDALNASTQINNILHDILDAVISFTRAGRGFLALIEGDQREPCIKAAYNLDGLDGQTHRRIIEEVISTGRGVIGGEAGEASGGTILCAPVCVHSETVGIICLDQPPLPELFTYSDLETIRACAVQAGLAVQNARLSAALSASKEERSKFISIVTHELRIPMTSIKGYTDLIRQGIVGQINEQQSNFLDIIRNNVERMSSLLSNLSDLSKIDSGRLRLSPKYTPIPEQVEEIRRIYLSKIASKNQALQVNLDADIRSVYADPDRVLQVLDNLVSNAHLYTPLAGHIQIRACNQDGKVLVQVCDDGIGISKEDQASLFTQFFRSEDMVVRDQQGWGLGLNLTRKLVELMNGNIGVDSHLGEGSTFWFTLPSQEV